MTIVEKEIEKAVKPRKQYNKDIPDVTKKGVDRYALIHGAKTTSDCFNKKYPKYTFVRTSINNWEKKMGSKYRQALFDKKGRPNLLNDNLLKKVKNVIVGTRAAAAVISHCLVIAIGKGVLKTSNPTMLMQNGGSLELSEDWTRDVLQFLKWTKRKGTTGKVEPSEQFLEKEKLIF